LRNKGIIITVGAMCCILTYMVAVQLRTVKLSESDITRLMNENELRDEINQWKDMYNIASEKIDELNLKVEEYRTADSKTNTATAIIKKELDDANIIAGLTKVKGKGIEVTLDDTEAINKVVEDMGYYDPNVFVIHDTDLLSVINELRAAGAEAISINGQRVMANTEIRCVGPVVSVNTARIAAPFKISAIGEPDHLASALALRNGIVDNLREYDINVTITKLEEIIIPKYDKAVVNKYAIPVVE
jgi:uncharacterized protein YlxW (UPF0749 family)